ncbi:MAG: cytochrome c oxidase subunit II [Chloroflexota bacterium]|jgi:cytochrome c oxidase subunit II
MGRFKHFIVIVVLTTLSTVGLRALFDVILALPMAASAEARPIDLMFSGHYWMIAFLFSLIMVMMLYAVFVFRRKDGDDSDGPHVHGNVYMEIGWTIVPTIIVIGFGLWGAVTLNEITRSKQGEMTIGVVGRQWVWSFSYPEQGDIVSSELVLPVNQTVVLNMVAEDILHSFWVPEFRVKQDLVPDRITYLRITPTEIGTYTLKCAEICGLNHTEMIAPVRVVSQTEFIAWVDERSDVPAFGDMTPEERGAFWASAEGYGCIGCHSLDGSPGAGPTWQGLYLREELLTDGTTVIADDDYIVRSIIHPNEQIVAGFQPNIMPQNYEERFAEREQEILVTEGVEISIIADLIAFIKTLD